MDVTKKQESTTSKPNYNKRSYLIMKRGMDIFISITLLVLFLPVLILIGFISLIIDGIPVLFLQVRTGKDNKPFVIWKFRTMTHDNKSDNHFHEYNWKDKVPDDFVFKTAGNPNVTKLGAFLRKYSLDELPQLINVLRGDMSIVGPRPEIPKITKFYNDEQSMRLLVKPGITGYAQINGRSEMNHGQKIAYDLYYIKNCSILLDMQIVFKTILQVAYGRGSY